MEMTPIAAGSRPLEVVFLYAFDSNSSDAYEHVNWVYWSVQDKLGSFASSSRLDCVYMASYNSYTIHKRFARSGEILVKETRRCTKNMACGLGEAHRLIRECKDDPNGVILFFSDGLVRKGDFYDGVEDFVSTWPVHTFTLGGEAYNEVLRAIAAKSPGGMFSPLPVPDNPRMSVVFSQHMHDILGTMKDDVTPPTPDRGEAREKWRVVQLEMSD